MHAWMLEEYGRLCYYIYIAQGTWQASGVELAESLSALHSIISS